MANIADILDHSGHGGARPAGARGAGAADCTGALTLRPVEDLAAAGHAWQAFEKEAVGTPFQSYAWVSAWVKANRDNGAMRPLIVFAYDGARIVLILPLAIARVMGARRLEWLGQRFSDYNGPLIERHLLQKMGPADAARLMARVRKLAGGADCCLLAKQPEFLGGLPNPFVAPGSYPFTCAAHYVRLAASWQDFEAAHMNGKSRRRLREKEAKLSQIGEVEYVRIDDPQDRALLVHELVGWKVAQLVARGDRVPFADPVARDFFNRVARCAAGQGPARLYALKCGGRAVAMALCFADRKRLVYYLCGYEVSEVTRHSPGLLLLVHLFKVAIEEGFEVFDFSNGDEDYKDRWSDGADNIMVTSRAFTPLGLLALAGERAKLELIRAVKRSDKVADLARRLIRIGRGATGGVKS